MVDEIAQVMPEVRHQTPTAELEQRELAAARELFRQPEANDGIIQQQDMDGPLLVEQEQPAQEAQAEREDVPAEPMPVVIDLVQDTAPGITSNRGDDSSGPEPRPQPTPVPAQAPARAERCEKSCLGWTEPRARKMTAQGKVSGSTSA